MVKLVKHNIISFQLWIEIFWFIFHFILKDFELNGIDDVCMGSTLVDGFDEPL